MSPPGTETGLTRLRFDPGPVGLTLLAGAAAGTLSGTPGSDVLQGGAGADHILAAAGDDILLDGAGSDWLTGGSGADTFVLSCDGTADRIVDFTPGQDKIDLSGWGLLRNIGQLQMVSTATGLSLSFGNEVLHVTRAGGGPISPASLTNADLINLTRLWANPGEPASSPTPTPQPGDLLGHDSAEVLTGTATANRMFGLDGDDTLYGGAGNDTLYGGAGHDRLGEGPVLTGFTAMRVMTFIS